MATSAFEKVHAYYDNDEKKTRRVAVAGVVVGALATYAALRLTQGDVAPTGSGSGAKEALLPHLNPGAKHQLGHHALTHAAKVSQEITLKAGGDSIWHEEYAKARELHPTWNAQQLNAWASEHTQRIMDTYDLTQTEAEHLQPGATFGS